MEPVISFIVTAGGLLFATLNFLQLMEQNRGKRFYERSVNLLDLRRRLDELGPVTGASASISSSRAHEQLLAEYEQEARANAALYVAAVSRLQKPGSYYVGFSSLAYAVPVALITGSTASQLLPLGPLPVVIGAGLPFLVTVALTWSGARLVLRRLNTGLIRKKIGELDPLSKEGLQRIVADVAKRTRAAVLQRKRSEPADASKM